MRMLIAGCVLLAGASLVLPLGPGLDQWAWLVWGREVLHLDLNTTGGPSWKPLPVLITTVLAPFGAAAPSLWLVVARAGALLAVALAYRLGARFAGPIAGALAGIAIVLVPGWLQLVARGNSEPLLVALILWAVERHLDGRRDHAFVLGVLASLVRPEAWPFLLVYGLWLWRAEPTMRLAIAGLGLAVPVLWFGGDLLGSGDALTGGGQARGERAQVLSALTAPLEVVAAPVLLAGLAAVVFAARAARSAAGRADRAMLVLAAGALAWIGVVVAMSALGYPGLSRFVLPAVAVLCVLAGVGVVRGVTAIPWPLARLAVGGLMLALALPFAVAGVRGLSSQFAAAKVRTEVDRQLQATAREAGSRDSLLACGAPVLNGVGGPNALAWELDVPLEDVEVGSPEAIQETQSGVVFAREPARIELESRAADKAGNDPDAVRLLASSGHWGAFAVGCPGIVDSSVDAR